jgi:hypothetical protein
MSTAILRTAAAGLLVAGLIGGLRLERQPADAADGTRIVMLSEADEMQILKVRQNRDAATRSLRRSAEAEVAAESAGRTLRAAVKARQKQKAAIDRAKAGVTFDGEVPGSCQEYSGNRAIGCTLMLAAGFEIAQFPCLEQLWDHESGWNHRAENKGSGAYGIPQAYPGSKMATAGADWRTNPATQIKWGLGYVKGRYKTPCGAWSNFQNNGSY